MSQLLEYTYAKIDLATGRCKSCMTGTYEINNPAYILVPYADGDYVGKYYHDGHWYADAAFTVPAPELDW